MTTLIITIPMLMFFTSTTSHVNLRRVVYNEGRDSLCCVHDVSGNIIFMYIFICVELDSATTRDLSAKAIAQE